ncbi:hypothetical protein [Nocardia sp. NPDC005366]|uniref:hypothetical protein n=1 Tax=Nocardia sp. NPDC005366 TaxID=3156878 RepID=UPI0033A73EFF
MARFVPISTATVRENAAPVTGGRWLYPTAVTTAGSSLGLADAVDWVSVVIRRIGGTPLLWVPKASTVATCTALREFVDNHRVVVAVAGEPIPEWHRGPVLAVWPRRAELAELADEPRTTALCVAPLRLDDIAAWAALTQPELLGAAIMPPAPPAPDPIVAQALITMTGMLTHPLTLVSPSDYRDATAILDILHRAGHRFSGEAIYTWALANGWPALGAGRLTELASSFDTGNPPLLPGGNPFQPGAIELWRARAAEATREDLRTEWTTRAGFARDLAASR